MTDRVRVPRGDSPMSALLAMHHDRSDAFATFMPSLMIGMLSFIFAPVAWSEGATAVGALLTILFVLAAWPVVLILTMPKVADYRAGYSYSGGVAQTLQHFLSIREPAFRQQALPVYASWRHALLAWDAEPTAAREAARNERADVLKALSEEQGKVDAARLLAKRGGDAQGEIHVESAREYLAALKAMPEHPKEP